MLKKVGILFAKLFLVISSLVIGACSVAPFTGPNSAKTVGKGKFNTVTTVLPTLGQSITYGLTDNTDIGALVEVQYDTVSSVWVKHNFLNNEVGHSFAGLAGAFLTYSDGNSSGFYIGPTWSYSSGKEWELYGMLKYNHVEWSGLSDIDENDLLRDITDSFDADSFDYFQLHGGAKYYFTPQFNLDVGMFMLMKTAVTTPIPSVGFGWSFE